MNSFKSTYHYISLTLAFLMLFTAAGFSVDMHYCQGQLKSFSFFGKANTCHDVADTGPMKNCQHHKKMMVQNDGCSIDKKDCCSSITLHFQSDQDQQVQTFDFIESQQLQQFVIAYVAVFFSNDFNSEGDALSFGHYKPPIISKDIPVLHQTFLL